MPMANPFEKLVIQGSDQSEKRPSFTKAELRQLIEAARIQDDERRRLVLCLALTGARLAEIVGLRKRDVDLEKMIISIVPHASRSLKTTNSKRRVPLHPWAAEALKNQVIESKNGYVFPAYANEDSVKSDSASAMLKKWLGTVLPQTQKTAHSMRHTMADLLREVETPSAIRHAICGWSNQEGVAEHYGEGYTDQVLRTHLMTAFKWLDD
jgi:integrase